MSGTYAAGMPDCSGFDGEGGYLEARRDRFGPFIQIRWRQKRMVVRERAWLGFLDEVCRGGYQPLEVAGRRGWVFFEIDEGFAENRPVGWTPKALEVPEIVWQRFVSAGGRGSFANLGHCWTGGLPQ